MGFVYDYAGARDQATYDLENAIADPGRRIEAVMESLVPFDGIALADIGAGGGYHACRYAQRTTNSTPGTASGTRQSHPPGGRRTGRPSAA